MTFIFRSLIIFILAALSYQQAFSSHSSLQTQRRLAIEKIQNAAACRAAVSRPPELPPILEELHQIFFRRFAMKPIWTGPSDVTNRWMQTSAAQKQEVMNFVKSYEANRILYPKTVKRVLDIILTYEEVFKNWSEEKLENARQNPKAFFEEVYKANTRNANIKNKINFSELMEFFVQVQGMMKNPEAVLKNQIVDGKAAYLPEDLVTKEDVSGTALRVYLAEHKKLPDDVVIPFHGSTVNGRGIREISDIDHANAGAGNSPYSDAFAHVVFHSEEFKDVMAKLGVKEVETHNPDTGSMSPLQVDVFPGALRLYLLLPIYDHGIEKPVRIYIGEI